MSATSKKSSGKKSKAIDRPFDAEVLRRARELVNVYQLVIKQESGGFTATVLELPNVFGFGETVNQCVSETQEILVTMLAYMIERGEDLPAPASENKRTEQVNIRLTPLEKLRLESAADNGGYRGISDYIREKAMREASPSRRSVRRRSKQAG